ncbi:sphingosine-1-phosphate lyase 1-like [Watersipora subatra]|uniref:sphingosine-1-phosphate lyase 1-like n=1 Tax=Watersipora subatra TaxID=2589382 RepID=UPI00355C07A7
MASESLKTLRMVVPGFKFFEDTLWHALEWMRMKVNGVCADMEAWQIVLLSAALLLLAQWLWEFFWCGEGGIAKLKKGTFRMARKIPYVKRQIAAEVSKTAHSMRQGFAKDLKPGMSFVRRLPTRGHSSAEVCALAEEYKSMDTVEINRGRASGTLYNGGEELTDLNARIYKMFAWTNPLHSEVFPDIRKMEAEVVKMCLTMFNGGPESCGTMTSGGTESIMLACKAFRDRAVNRGISRPEMVIPRSAHAAFEKACQTFNILARIVHADSITMKVDVRQMEKLINKNTCMLVGSAPDFPMGMIDPIEDIAKLGIKYDIPVHVDACLGGFLIAFMEKAGFPLPLFDFRIPGVSSISCDTHKYGFAPKGSSVILYANNELRRYQFYIITDWPGGIYATPTLGGSRPGAIIAACWATMMYFGEEGYIRSTADIINTTRYIRDSLREIPGLFVYGEPLVSVVTVGSLDFDIFRLKSGLEELGWNLNALQFPSSIHLCCTLLHTKPGIADEFISDVRRCTAKIMANPAEKASGMAAMYGMSQTIPDRSLVGELVMEFLDALYDTSYSASMSNGHTQ